MYLPILPKSIPDEPAFESSSSSESDESELESESEPLLPLLPLLLFESNTELLLALFGVDEDGFFLSVEFIDVWVLAAAAAAAAALVLFVEDGSAAVSMDVVEVEVEGGSGFVDILFMKIWF